MKVSAEESLWLAFPILLVIIVLVSGIIYLQNSNTDVRSRASEPKQTIEPATRITPVAPEVICNDIYEPVCGNNNKTYSNACEANQAGIQNITSGVCANPTPIPIPNTP